MTPRQQRFVDEYLVDLNATQAAIRAGYSARTANEQSPCREVLARPKVASHSTQPFAASPMNDRYGETVPLV
jgi:phage terminase small subunit